MTLLPVHILAGSIGIVSGFVALSVLKGGKLHRKAGMIFVYAMLTLSATGAVIAATKGQRINFIAGCLTFYLVTTALLTVRRRVQGFHWTNVGAMLIGLTTALFAFKFGFDAVNSPTGTLDGLPPPPAFMFGVVGLIAAYGDLRMMRAGDLCPVDRHVIVLPGSGGGLSGADTHHALAGCPGAVGVPGLDLLAGARPPPGRAPGLSGDHGGPEMTGRAIEPEQRTAAKIAGFWYLIAMVAGMFAALYAQGRLIVPGDAVQTANNITASEWLFRVGTVTHLIVFAGDVILLVALYVILKPINRNLALLAAFWRLLACAILAVVLLNDFATLRLLSGVDYLHVFDTKELQALARFFISVNAAGFQIGFVFLGLGSAVYSYLWLKSRYIPRVLAAWGIFASLAMAILTLAGMVFTDLAAVGMVFMLPMFVYEVGLGFWLIIKGIREPAGS